MDTELSHNLCDDMYSQGLDDGSWCRKECSFQLQNQVCIL